MTAPKFVFRNGTIVNRAKLAPKTAPVDEGRIWAVLHNFNARLVALETASAALTAPAVKPTALA
jgi:hypothetical protein